MQAPAEVRQIATTRRGSKRPGYTRISSTLAAVTNDPIALVKTNIARNADARRWRDLLLYYQKRIGDVRMRGESVRVRVLALVRDAGTREAHGRFGRWPWWQAYKEVQPRPQTGTRKR